MSTTAIIVIGIAFVIVDGLVLYKVLIRSRRAPESPREAEVRRSRSDASDAFGTRD